MDFAEILQHHELRATEKRIKLFEFLYYSSKPVTIEMIFKKLKKFMDKVTIYRNLDEFVCCGLVQKSDFLHGASYFEYKEDGKQNYHITCKECGTVSHFYDEKLEKVLASIQKVRGYKTVLGHSCEFFGVCSKCKK